LLAVQARAFPDCACQGKETAMSKNHDRHPKTRYGGPDRNLKRKSYEKELEKLQVELVKLQEWIKYRG